MNLLARIGFALASACAIALPVHADNPATVIKIDKVTFVELGGSSKHEQLELPSLRLRSQRTFQRFRLRADFTVTDTRAASLWAVYFLTLYDGGRVSVNGLDIGDVQTSSPQTTVRHARPYMFPIPPDLLHSGSNRVEVEWGARETLLLISSIVVGPADLVRQNYEQRLFWQNHMSVVTFVYALVIATILLGIYTLRRNQRSYLLMGLSAAGCAIVVYVYILPPMAASLYPYWRLFHIVGIATFTSCAWLFLIRESRPENRWFPQLCIFWGVLGPSVYGINFWINDVSYFRAFEGVWGVVAGIIGLYPVYCLARAMVQKASWRKLVFLLATGFAIVMGISDIVLQTFGSSVFGNFGYSVQTVAPLWLTAMTALMMSDFLASLSEQDTQSQRMAHTLAQQKAQLLGLHEASRQREHEWARLEERQRIMRDMHDGLGSQLIKSFNLSERGALSKEQTGQLFRDCIDDLRLAIDAFPDSDDQFGVAAGNLRFRMEPRLRSVGVNLKWDSKSLLESAVTASKTLPLLRIMQEVINNAVTQAKVTQIAVSLSSDKECVVVQIHDDGLGFDASAQMHMHVGDDCGGMAKWARGIGADVSVTRIGGTTVRIVLPLAAPKRN